MGGIVFTTTTTFTTEMRGRGEVERSGAGHTVRKMNKKNRKAKKRNIRKLMKRCRELEMKLRSADIFMRWRGRETLKKTETMGREKTRRETKRVPARILGNAFSVATRRRVYRAHEDSS